jgi:hypothetical protein
MPDPNEIAALQASFRGATATAGALAALGPRIESLDPNGEIGAAELDEIARVTLAHAVAAQALRGLVNTMRARRGTPAA